MKKCTNPYKFLLTLSLLLAAACTFANGEDGEKKKTYTKSYPVSASEKISVTNQFGEVRVTTWNKAEVKVDVVVITRSESDERAQSILDGISIEDGKNSEGVFFKTVMPKNNNNNNNHDRKGDKDKRGNHNEGMEINYTVTMPAANPLKLENQFGKTFLPDLSGPVEITEKFGELVAGNLSNVKNLQVEFGKAAIEGINNGKMTVKFSEASVKKMSGAIKASFEFSGKVTLPLSNSVTDFNLNNSYSSITISVTNDFSGDFEIHTNFGDFKNSTSLPIKEQKDEDDHGPKFDKDYSGKSGTGACKVKMKSSFGNIKLM